MKNIYEYLDYRKFVSDFFVEQRENSPFFSFRYAEKKVGVDASNLSKIVQGKRHITNTAFDSFVKLFKFDERETSYFRLLINFSKSRNEKSTREYFEQIMTFNSITANKIETDRYEFYQQWYYTAVLALLYFFPAKWGDWKEIGEHLQPKINDEQAEKAVALLQKLNFIKVSAEGDISHTNSIITSGEQWKSIALETFQKQTIQLALEAMDTATIDERYISTLTVTLSDDSYQRIKAVTAEYRKAVLKEVAESGETNRVYQINLQMFPLCKRSSDVN